MLACPVLYNVYLVCLYSVYLSCVFAGPFTKHMWSLLGDGVGAEEQGRGHAQPHHGERLGKLKPQALAAAVYIHTFLKLQFLLPNSFT